MDDHRHFSYITKLEVKKGKKKKKKRYSSKAYYGCWALWRAFGFFFLIWRPFIYLFICLFSRDIRRVFDRCSPGIWKKRK
jgi:hypothetical protein